MSSKFSWLEIIKLDTPKARQALLVEWFNQAMRDDDAKTAVDVAEFVIGDDKANAEFSASFQMHCLSWLVRYYRRLYSPTAGVRRYRQFYSQTADDSPKNDEYWEYLFEALWKLKWIVARLPDDLGMDKQEIAQANDLMKELYTIFKLGQSAVAKTFMHQSMKLGDFQAAKQHFHDWQNGENHIGNDCDACEQNSAVQYHHFMGDYARVVELAQPILSGEMVCGEVPHTTYEFVIDSLIKLNQTEKARELLDEAIDLIEQSIETNLYLLPNLITLLNRVNEHDRARELLDEYNDDIINFCNNNQLYYLNYLICVAPLNDNAISEAELVAKQIDARNNNSFYQDKVAFQFGKIMIH